MLNVFFYSLQVLEGAGLGSLRTPGSVQGQTVFVPNSCVCTEKFPSSVVAGANVRAALLTPDVSATVACSVVAVMKHVVAPMCTWKGRDVDDILVKGNKLVSSVAQASQKNVVEPKDLCKFMEEHNVFGRKWSVNVGVPVYKDVGLEDEAVMFEELGEHLLRDGMCLLNLSSAVCAIVHHQDYFVVVDCGTRDVFGKASRFGAYVAVFNTCFNDLFFHIRDLKKSLGAEWYSIMSISVRSGEVECDSERATVTTDSDVNVKVEAQVKDSSSVTVGSHVRSVRGTFQYGGLQCMAISLIALAEHTVESVFSWQSHKLDQVVVSGDK